MEVHSNPPLRLPLWAPRDAATTSSEGGKFLARCGVKAAMELAGGTAVGPGGTVD